MLASTLYNLGTHRDSQRYDAGENGPRSSKAAIHPQTMPLKNPNGDTERSASAATAALTT